MITIHWLLILLIASVSGIAGFMLCAILTMGKVADQAIGTLNIKVLIDSLEEAKMDIFKTGRLRKLEDIIQGLRSV